MALNITQATSFALGGAFVFFFLLKLVSLWLLPSHLRWLSVLTTLFESTKTLFVCFTTGQFVAPDTNDQSSPSIVAAAPSMDINADFVSQLKISTRTSKSSSNQRRSSTLSTVSPAELFTSVCDKPFIYSSLPSIIAKLAYDDIFHSSSHHPSISQIFLDFSASISGSSGQTLESHASELKRRIQLCNAGLSPPGVCLPNAINHQVDVFVCLWHIMHVIVLDLMHRGETPDSTPLDIHDQIAFQWAEIVLENRRQPHRGFLRSFGWSLQRPSAAKRTAGREIVRDIELGQMPTAGDNGRLGSESDRLIAECVEHSSSWLKMHITLITYQLRQHDDGFKSRSMASTIVESLENSSRLLYAGDVDSV